MYIMSLNVVYTSAPSTRLATRYSRSLNWLWPRVRSTMRACVMSPATKDLGERLLAGQRHALAKGITLIESTKSEHREQANSLLDYVLEKKHEQRMLNRANNLPINGARLFDRGTTMRVGIAGPPGAGKSTFIEALGMLMIGKGHKVAVIPVDPSSHISGGSILGDKTRMDELSRHKNAYVRASPTRGILGGVAEHTHDVITLCEVANYDFVIVESVGLGQSEVDIDSAVDMLIMLVPPGGGDGLQATKKGIMEAADLVLINKADGTLLTQAKHTLADYAAAVSFIRRKQTDWVAKVLMISAREQKNLNQVVDAIGNFRSTIEKNGQLTAKRLEQSVHWMWSNFRRQLINNAEKKQNVQTEASKLVAEMELGRVSPRAAAFKLLSHVVT